MKHTYKKLKLSCLVVLGGNGSQKTANKMCIRDRKKGVWETSS